MQSNPEYVTWQAGLCTKCETSMHLVLPLVLCKFAVLRRFDDEGLIVVRGMTYSTKSVSFDLFHSLAGARTIGLTYRCTNSCFSLSPLAKEKVEVSNDSRHLPNCHLEPSAGGGRGMSERVHASTEEFRALCSSCSGIR